MDGRPNRRNKAAFSNFLGHSVDGALTVTVPLSFEIICHR